MTHEYVNINAALGYAAVSGAPVVTAVHTDVGTLNYGAGIHNAARSRLPVILTAGTPATAMPGTMRGSRDGGHFWTQQTRDQNGIVRQYVKWDHRLEYQDNPKNIVTRAVQVATSEPAGPVYLSIPREIAMMPSRQEDSVTLASVGVVNHGAFSPEAADSLLRRIIQADKPVLVAGRGGRRMENQSLLAALVERLALPVVDGFGCMYQPLPLDHPQYRGLGDLSDADLVIVLENDVPWFPGASAPPESAYVLVVDPDPIAVYVPVTEFRASERLASTTSEFSHAMLRATAGLSSDDEFALAKRRDGIREDVEAHRRVLEEQALARYRSDIIDPLWASYYVASVLPENTLLIDDTVMSAPVRSFLGRSRGKRLFRNPSTAGGWGPGAAFGAKLAAPDSFVCLVTGDGFYTYGAPVAALWAARAYNAPFMSIVFQNDSYNTGTEEVQTFYPDGHAARAGFPGGYFVQPVDFAIEATAAGAYGENVSDPTKLEEAINRCVSKVKSGQSAVLAIQLPRLLELPPSRL